jgi:hypothetical protein
MSRLAESLQRAWRFLLGTRLKPLLVLAAVCLTVREQYPFSHFPMYSSFSKSTYYVYLTDGAGQPVATLPTVGMSTPTLKKVFDSELRNERRLRSDGKDLGVQQRQEVARRVLERLKNSAAARDSTAGYPAAMRLYQVTIKLAQGRYDKETILLAEL